MAGKVWYFSTVICSSLLFSLGIVGYALSMSSALSGWNRYVRLLLVVPEPEPLGWEGPRRTCCAEGRPPPPHTTCRLSMSLEREKLSHFLYHSNANGSPGAPAVLAAVPPPSAGSLSLAPPPGPAPLPRAVRARAAAAPGAARRGRPDRSPCDCRGWWPLRPGRLIALGAAIGRPPARSRVSATGSGALGASRAGVRSLAPTITASAAISLGKALCAKRSACTKVAKAVGSCAVVPVSVVSWRLCVLPQAGPTASCLSTMRSTVSS